MIYLVSHRQQYNPNKLFVIKRTSIDNIFFLLTLQQNNRRITL
jgi:hypothetical protein